MCPHGCPPGHGLLAVSLPSVSLPQCCPCCATDHIYQRAFLHLQCAVMVSFLITPPCCPVGHSGCLPPSCHRIWRLDSQPHRCPSAHGLPHVLLYCVFPGVLAQQSKFFWNLSMFLSKGGVGFPPWESSWSFVTLTEWTWQKWYCTASSAGLVHLET